MMRIQPCMTNRANVKGFTLIELVTVIVILGILSVVALPRFIDLSFDAHAAVVRTHGAALQSGADLAHTKWLAMGAPAGFAERNNIQLWGNAAQGQIDLTPNGWPAQSWPGQDVILSTDNDDDCLSLWIALIQDGENKAALDQSADFVVNYEGNGTCSYTLVVEPLLSFLYDSNNGRVTYP